MTLSRVSTNAVGLRRTVPSCAEFVNYPDCYERVKSNIAVTEFVGIVRGALPGTLDAVTDREITFRCLDMNYQAPALSEKPGYDLHAKECSLQILTLVSAGRAILI